MRAADVTIVNLETLIHEFNGYAQAHSGGTYVASPPEIAGELKWAGVDMMSCANNHAFDYGSTGILEDDRARRGGRPHPCGHRRGSAGGAAACYSEMSRRNRGHGFHGRRHFTPYGRASRSRPGMRGRPGLNPLGLTESRGGDDHACDGAGARAICGFGAGARQAGSKPAVVRFFGVPLLIEEKARLAGGRGIDPGRPCRQSCSDRQCRGERPT